MALYVVENITGVQHIYTKFKGVVQRSGDGTYFNSTQFALYTHDYKNTT